MIRLPFRFVLALAFVATAFGASPRAEAQTITVQGQVQVQPYGQPQGYAQPPPGYGQAQPNQVQPYAPTYAPTYRPVQRQVRYEDRETSVKALWIPGIIVFGVSFVLSGTLGSLSFDSDYSTWSWVPLIGPWVALTYANNDDEAIGSTLAGVAQVAGLTMFILGLTLTRTVSVATYSFDEHDGEAPRLGFGVLPAPGGGQLGLTLSHF